MINKGKYNMMNTLVDMMKNFEKYKKYIENKVQKI